MDSSSSDESSGSVGFHRTLQQTDVLERMFEVCPNPDKAQRMELETKVQVERDDIAALRAENDRLRADNVAVKEALRRYVCRTCVPPPAVDSITEYKMLQRKNIRLKEKLKRLSKATKKILGKSITRLPPVQVIPGSPLDVSLGDFRNSGRYDSIELGLLYTSSSSISFPSPEAVLEVNKPVMLGIATAAMEELMKLVEANEPLWTKIGDSKEVLNLDTYDMIFPGKSQRFKHQDILIESSRSSGVVMADATTLVDMFMVSDKWVELFPTIVAQGRTFEVLSTGITGNKCGSLALMYEEQQTLSPVVPTRKFCFLRLCQQTDLGLWMIADVSVDFPTRNQHTSPSICRKLPSGCLIKDLSNGYSMITWIEHVEIEAKNPINQLYRDLVHTGMAFGAQRWLSALQRMCERHACVRATEISSGDFGEVSSSLDGKRRLMKLAQRMMNNFCSNLSSSDGHQWAIVSGFNDVGIRVNVHKNQHHGVVISAATSVLLRLPSDRVFKFFRDQSTRSQWDILTNGNLLQEVTHISNGSIPGNSISLFKVTNYEAENMLILQESCTDNWGSILVYSVLDLPSMNDVISGDPSSIPLLPSGFTILPYGHESTGGGASTSSNPMGGSAGSLVTMSFQILASSLPSSNLNQDSLTAIKDLICSSMQRIKAALDCLPMA